jgi:hypothetical protein
MLLKVYANCIDGQGDAANQRITAALGSPAASGTLLPGDDAPMGADSAFAGQPRDTDPSGSA